jgi:anaerobic magnesium-protoporphyrin IX monomethyl ester cyclase
MLAPMRTLLTTLHSKYIHPSLALPSLAAFCREGCGELLIREFTVHEPKENVLALLLQEEPDAIAFSVYLWNRRETFELIDLLYAARPEIKLVIGGPEVSFDGPELFARHPGLAVIVRGEGELPLRQLLQEWQTGQRPTAIPRTLRRLDGDIVEGPPGPELDELDLIPSPFRAGLVDISRGFVYFETSRGCPYRCSFCMSALDDRVRSFSRERIESDLLWLMQQRVPKIKLVDRTFNYHPQRAREIFRFILRHNRGSHFHFEIGAHLLDRETLLLLAEVPPGMFQFEIGIQSTLEATLEAIDRKVDRQKLEEHIADLQKLTRIDLHLDLIAGLPGESLQNFLGSVDRVMAGEPEHLQIEPVKLLPGSPLRRQAAERGIRFDPNPPYTVLETPSLAYRDLQLLKNLSRLLDQSWNQRRLRLLLNTLSGIEDGFAAGLKKLTEWWQANALFRHPLSQEGLFLASWDFVAQSYSGADRERLRLALGRDYAHSQRVLPDQPPSFFDTSLREDEQLAVRERVKLELEASRGQGIKLQHFAAVFENRAERSQREILLFIYRTGSGRGMQVTEIPL